MNHVVFRLCQTSNEGNKLHLRFDIIEKPHGSWFKVNHHGSWLSIWFKVKFKCHRSRSKVKVIYGPNSTHSTHYNSHSKYII